MNLQNCMQAVSSHTLFDQEEAESIIATLAFLGEQSRFWQRTKLSLSWGKILSKFSIF
jgi:hypothetical protein